MKNYLVSKTLVMGIIILFIGSCIIPTVNSIISNENIQLNPNHDYHGYWKYPDYIYSKITQPFGSIDSEQYNYKTTYDNKDFSITQTDSKVVKKSYNPLSNGKTLYVGGPGPNNYTWISYAINDANDGDTVFVYDDSSPYYERSICISKSINLIGENKETTVIDGKHRPWGIDVSADGVTITGLTIQNFAYYPDNPYFLGGIIIRSSNNVISGNIISNSGYGIIISGSNAPANYNTISDNIIKSNGDCGAYIQKSNNNIISMNTFSDNYYFGGLGLSLSRYNDISDNVFINDGVYFYDSYKNSFLNNTINDKFLIYLEEKSNKILEGDAGQVILIKCDNITVQNQDLSNTSIGLFLCDTNNCLILNNTFSSSDYGGILLCRSDNNNISMNIISNEDVGIFCYYSHDNTIFSNTISNNMWLGILIRSSNSNSISMNTFLDNVGGLALDAGSLNNIVSDNIFINDGVFVYGAWKNTFLNNFVNNKPLIYLEDESDKIIDENAGQVILVSCNNITVTNQEIYDIYTGIILIDAHNCHILDNILSSNKEHGIFQTHSSTNNISANTISDNHFGLIIEYSDENIIFRNNINSNKYYGLYLSSSNHTIVYYNTIEKNGGQGIFLLESSNNKIHYNNFLRNEQHAYFHESFSNNWNHNYWNRPRLLPKIIIGETKDLPPFDIRFNFDWRPALKPYVI